MTIRRTMVIILIALALFASCGTTAKQSKVVYSLGGEAETLDPTKNIYAQSSIVLQNLFRGLYKTGADGSTVPAIAASYTMDASGTKYVFKLKKSRWSDGKALTQLILNTPGNASSIRKLAQKQRSTCII